jgi:Domain of unknown function (DUF4292)
MKMKLYTYAILFFASLVACKTVKKVTVIQDAMVKKDTTQLVMLVETPKVDSAAIVRGIMKKVISNKIDFKTFNAKIKIDYESAENSDSYTGYLSMIKDSVIYIRIRGSSLGISAEGLQVKIKKDSVILVWKIGKKNIEYKSIAYLQETTQIPFDFYTLQDMLIGNPIFIDDNIVSYKDGPASLLVLMLGDVFKHLITLETKDLTISHSKLDDIDIQRNRTCDITFGNYQQMGTYQFATSRKIAVAEKSKLDINLNFKEFTLNEPLKYSFEVPKNNKRK